jgi:hypothetical protein
VIANPAVASHLAELEARYEGHLAALRSRAEQLHERVAGEASVLTERLTPLAVPSASGVPLLADTPLLAPDDIPLGPDA